ncbi:MAG: hypothetical protein HDT13_07785 [Butyrivibrio sp.]|nr:hypothetical protein [Butyrivibrio sp.]
MGNNILVTAIIGAAAVSGLMTVLASLLKNKKFLYVIPAVIGLGALSIGASLFMASSWRAISVGALAAGAAGILVSVFLFVRSIACAKH